jgi:hypothetical protein
MGIEFRRDRAYYYRKRRVGGRVVSEYAGGGLLALVARERAEEGRAERAAADAAWRAERARMEEAERAAVAYCDQIEARAREMLTAMGYHRPKRQWRKRRGRVEEAEQGG